mgnify:CR=1 FL=1
MHAHNAYTDSIDNLTMTLIGELGERELIADFCTFIRKEGSVGPGDDAAVLTNGTVASTDVVTFDRHFPAGMSYEQFGWYAAAVSFSDLAAMGARPTGFLAALALPGDLDAQAAYDIMSGISQCAEYCGTGIAGGDTKIGPGVVAGTALGTLNNSVANVAVLDVLERHGATRSNACILHWFSGSSQELARARELGCHFSVNPNMLATKRGRAYVRQIPPNRLLLETDLPEEGEVAAQAGPAWIAQLKRAAELLGEILG